MSTALARPLLHTAHLLTFALLFATGLLLFLPGLRGAVTGGHSLLIRNAHRWGGVAFVVLPLLIMLRFGVRSLAAAPAARTLRTLWQGGHVGLTVRDERRLHAHRSSHLGATTSSGRVRRTLPLNA